MAERGGPAGPAGGVTFRSVGELAELCGHYCWVERRLFELTGSRACRPAPGELDTGDPETDELGTGEVGAGDAEIRVLLHQMSATHGFAAAQWRDRLPVRAGVDAEALIVPPAGPTAEVLELIESEPRLVAVLEALALQFLPWLLHGYDLNLARASPVSEAPVRAVLEWASRATGREIRLAGQLVARLAAAGEGAGAGGDTGPLVHLLLGDAHDSFPGARAS